MIEKITKKFERKLTLDFSSWLFSTEIQSAVKVNSRDDLVAENDKLFQQCKLLTDRDIDFVSKEIRSRSEEQLKRNKELEKAKANKPF